MTAAGGVTVTRATEFGQMTMVAAPTFPLSSDGAPGGETVSDLENQPGDLRFVTTAVLEQGLQPCRSQGHGPRHTLPAGVLCRLAVTLVHLRILIVQTAGRLCLLTSFCRETRFGVFACPGGAER